MKLHLVFAMALCWPAIASAQMNGRFYLEKEIFAPGEPVFLYFEVTNHGSEPQQLPAFDLYSFCSSYVIRVSNDPDPNLNWQRVFIGGSCLSDDVDVNPGKSVTQRRVLNYDHNIDTPGDYEVDAATGVPELWGKDNPPSAAGNDLRIRQQIHFRVDANATPDGREISRLVKQLKSRTRTDRYRAAVALTSAPPKSLEDLFLSLATDKDLRLFAPMALYKLNTPRSMEALAELLRTSEAGMGESMDSAMYLAKSGDPRWYPLLLESAKAHSNICNYVAYAAESGGDQMVPELVSMMSSTDRETAVANAITALGYTGSRSAVPILLELLKSPDEGTPSRALDGLRLLTHRTVSGPDWWKDPQEQYAAWSRWWNREGRDAPIYKPDDYGPGKILDCPECSRPI